MKKILVPVLVVMLVLSCLGGCAEGKNVPAETVQETAAYVPETVTVDRTEERDGKKLTIHAEVEVPELKKLENVTLKFDEEAFQAAGRDLILSQYPELKEEDEGYGVWGWSKVDPDNGNLIISFDSQTEGFRAGWCGYLDVLRDVNGQDMEGDELRHFERGYLTSNIPNKLEMTSAEAAEKVAGVLEKYTCFTYEPWNVTACNVREKPDSTGCYDVDLETCFDGKAVTGEWGLQASGHLSAEGLFEFQNVLLLKETGRTEVSCGTTLEEVLADFQENFPYFIYQGELIVEEIEAGWIAMSEYDGTWTLYPAWLFQCLERSDSHDHYFTCAYKMETGTLFVEK